MNRTDRYILGNEGAAGAAFQPYNAPTGGYDITPLLQRLVEKGHDPRLAKMVSSMVSQSSPDNQAVSQDMWARNQGVGAELASPEARDTGAEMTQQALDQAGSLYRTPDGRITNVNRGVGELVQGRTPAEVYDSGGSFQTFKQGLERPESNTPSDMRLDMLYLRKTPQDAERELKTLLGLERDLSRRRYHQNYQNEDTGEIDQQLLDVRKEIAAKEAERDSLRRLQREVKVVKSNIKRGVGDEDELRTRYNRLMDQLGRPYESRLDIAKKEKELKPEPRDFRTTREYAKMTEQEETRRKILGEEYGIRKELVKKILTKPDTLTKADKADIYVDIAENFNDPLSPFTITDMDGTRRRATPEEKQQMISEIYNQTVQTVEGTPAPPPAPGGPLDEATAKQILQEAGGDKEMARQIARQRGYSF